MNIALIDDNKTVLTVNELMLKKEKYITEEDLIDKFTDINSFRQDRTLIEVTNKYNMIICDYDLGKESINGLEFLKSIKATGYIGSCVLLTGDDSITMKTKMLLQSNINYIIKNKNHNETIIQLGKLITDFKKN